MVLNIHESHNYKLTMNFIMLPIIFFNFFVKGENLSRNELDGDHVGVRKIILSTMTEMSYRIKILEVELVK